MDLLQSWYRWLGMRVDDDPVAGLGDDLEATGSAGGEMMLKHLSHLRAVAADRRFLPRLLDAAPRDVRIDDLEEDVDVLPVEDLLQAQSSHLRSSLYSVSRCTGIRPASWMNRTSSGIFCSVAVRAPAAWKISSRTTVPCTSFAPKCNATCASGKPIMIQYALTFGMLSSSSRDTAMSFRSSEPVVCFQPRRSKTVFSGWNASGMKARKPPVLSCCSRRRSRWSTRSSYVSTCP